MGKRQILTIIWTLTERPNYATFKLICILWPNFYLRDNSCSKYNLKPAFMFFFSLSHFLLPPLTFFLHYYYQQQQQQVRCVSSKLNYQVKTCSGIACQLLCQQCCPDLVQNCNQNLYQFYSLHISSLRSKKGLCGTVITFQ